MAINPLISLAAGARAEVLTDASPSACISFAAWVPNVILLTFVRGNASYMYPCGLETWLAYKVAPSKGTYVNARFVGREFTRA